MVTKNRVFQGKLITSEDGERSILKIYKNSKLIQNNWTFIIK